ncbi:MAG TPA: lipid-A-disaccharide synthase [Burkholderiales bacterium]|jgi:lipid-A-disaccharide synthase|nr:lipid-A-disaccharide synthase [Burkholderiales bacterium]
MADAPLTVGVVAGEASGDLLGAHLIGALRERLPQARFAGIGGPRMQSAGLHALFPMEKLAVRGYVEVLRHYLDIVGIRRRLARHFLAEPPALFVGIDAPDFNLGLELKLRSAGIPTAHFVSPSIWAWRGGRIHKIKRAVSQMLAVFPFEQALYERAGVPVSYVGHPLAEMLFPVPERAAAREQLRLPAAARIIALLPGSRVSELEQLADLFIETAVQISAVLPDAHFLVPLVNRPTRELFETARYRHDRQLNLTVLFGHAHEAMAASDVVLAASGTATLEAALLQRPVVIAYRMPGLSWLLMKNRGYLPYVGLPNILAGEFIVPEFLQDEATPENLAQALLNLMFDTTVRERLEARFAEIAGDLRQDSAERIVSALMPLIGNGAAT